MLYSNGTDSNAVIQSMHRQYLLVEPFIGVGTDRKVGRLRNSSINHPPSLILPFPLSYPPLTSHSVHDLFYLSSFFSLYIQLEGVESAVNSSNEFGWSESEIDCFIRLHDYCFCHYY